jgi:hypothetical protein
MSPRDSDSNTPTHGDREREGDRHTHTQTQREREREREEIRCAGGVGADVHADTAMMSKSGKKREGEIEGHAEGW